MRRLTFLLFFVSGGVALLYEVVWLRVLVLILGSTHVAVTLVLTAFMAGLALGALAFGRYADSTRWHPLVLFALLEIGIGVSALAARVLLDPVGPVGTYVAGQHLLSYALPLLVLLPPTVLMGGSLPMLSRFVARRPDRIGPSVGYLYAANTFGAVFGTALTGFVLIPQLGVNRTTNAAVLANFILGAVALIAAR